jgi:nucleotide-binding universal stress UspA family protein
VSSTLAQDTAMNGTVTFVAVGLGWVSIGILAGFLMGRQGHSWFAWTILGAVLGPLVVPLVISELRHYRGVEGQVLMPGVSETGSVDALVGIDGSPEALAALDGIVRLIGPRLGRLTLAAVMEYGYQKTPAGIEEEKLARARLKAAAQSVSPISAETVLLQGQPADALSRHVERHGHNVIAIGSRGRGASTAFLGSVASHLARHSPMPVLIVSGGRREEAAPST